MEATGRRQELWLQEYHNHLLYLMESTNIYITCLRRELFNIYGQNIIDLLDFFEGLLMDPSRQLPYEKFWMVYGLKFSKWEVTKTVLWLCSESVSAVGKYEQYSG
jgi:hypothetical protein